MSATTTVCVPGPLRPLTGGLGSIDVAAASVREAIAELDRRYPGVASRLFDERGALRPFVRLFVDARDIGELAGLDTPLRAGGELAIVPAIAGGSGSVRGPRSGVRGPHA